MGSYVCLTVIYVDNMEFTLFKQNRSIVYKKDEDANLLCLEFIKIAQSELGT